MMKKTPAEDLADDYMRFYNAWTGKTMTREEAIRDIKDHPVYALDQQLDMFKQSYGTSELRDGCTISFPSRTRPANWIGVTWPALSASITSPTFI